MNNLDKLQSMEKTGDSSCPDDPDIADPTYNMPPVVLNSPVLKRIQKPFKLGICGGQSAGKAVLTEKTAERLRTKYGFKIKVVKQDHFEIDSDEIMNPQAEGSEQAKRIPIINQKEWESFMLNAKKALSDSSLDVVIIEGTLIFHEESLRNYFDLKVFLDNDSDVRLSRRIYKEVCQKNQDIKSIVQNYLSKQKPLYEMYIKPSKRFADFIVPQFGGGFSLTEKSHSDESRGIAQAELLVRFIRAELLQN